MDGLLTSLSSSDLTKYFPHRQFVERHQVRRQVRNPGTGEMVVSRRWDPLEDLKPIPSHVEFPTEHELRSLNEIDWVATPFDNYIFASLIALLTEPINWGSKINEMHHEILRFQSHPIVQCETIFRISKQMAKPLTKMGEFDFQSDEFDKSLVDYRYFKDIDQYPNLPERIAKKANESLSPDSSLILWCRGDY